MEIENKVRESAGLGDVTEDGKTVLENETEDK